MLIQVEFSEGGFRYTYQTEDEVQVGDMVEVEGMHGPTAVPVVALGSEYPGEVKSINRVVQKADEMQRATDGALEAD